MKDSLISIDLSKLKNYFYRFDKTINIELMVIESFSYYVDNKHNFIKDLSNRILKLKFEEQVDKEYELKDIGIFYNYKEYLKYVMTIYHHICKQILNKLDLLDFNNIFFNRMIDYNNLIVEFKIV